MGFVNVLNFNTLGHLSLRPNPWSVSDQTSYFLIWFGSKVAQERAEGGRGEWWLSEVDEVGLGCPAHHLMKSWCAQGEVEGWSCRSGRHTISRKRRASREMASLAHLFFSRLEEHARLVKGAHRCGPHYAADAASGTRQAPKWTRIELQVINLLKPPLEHGELTRVFVFICQDMCRDGRGQAWGALNQMARSSLYGELVFKCFIFIAQF